MINPKEKNALPYPNILQTADPQDFKDVVVANITDEDVAKHRLSDEAFQHVVQQLFEATQGEEKTHYYELALWHVDDFLTGTFDKETILDNLKRRFGKITIHINGGMFLGHDVEYFKERSLIVLRLKTHVERVMESTAC
jgi:hypothetical protein